jgi:2-keto-4-pentenoate hydratase
VMRQQMNIAEPNHGPLTSAMLLPNDTVLPGSLTQPRVEPEVALVLAANLPADCSTAQAAAAIGSVRAALEVVDSVWIDYRFTLADNTADGSSAAAVVVGPELGDVQSSDRVRVELFGNGRPVGVGQGADAFGHPLQALRWLARALEAQGEGIRAGDVVITGGLTAAVPIARGEVVTAVFDRADLGSAVEVSVRR